MIQSTRNAVANGLSDALEAAIDTANVSDVADVLARANESFTAGEIDILQLQSLETTAEIAGYDL